MKITMEFDSVKELLEFVKNEYVHTRGIKDKTQIVGSSLGLMLQKYLEDAGFDYIEDVQRCTHKRLLDEGLDADAIAEIRAWRKSA